MTDLGFAAQTFGIYSGLIYGTPLIGAWLGDRVLGKTRTIILGCLLMSAGHLAMAFEQQLTAASQSAHAAADRTVGGVNPDLGREIQRPSQPLLAKRRQPLPLILPAGRPEGLRQAGRQLRRGN